MKRKKFFITDHRHIDVQNAIEGEYRLYQKIVLELLQHCFPLRSNQSGCMLFISLNNTNA
jgi:hypothetical protein